MPPSRVTIDILYSEACPHVADAEREIARALDRAGVQADVRRVLVRTEQEAAERGFVGSPTVRVNGHDLVEDATGERPTAGVCRDYVAGGGEVLPYPPASLVERKLHEEANPGAIEREVARAPSPYDTEAASHAAPWDPRGPHPHQEDRPHGR